MAYALVKFKLDGLVQKVPVTFIKDHDKCPVVAGIEALVFWSPKEKDTPDSILRSQGKILEVEKLPESKKRKTVKDPIAGHYTAEILKIADSEKELDNPKRISVPTAKVVQSNCEHYEIKKKKSSDSAKQQNGGLKVEDQVLSKSQKKKLKIQANNDMMRELDKKYKPNVSCSSSETESDDQLVEKREYKRKIKNLKVELDRANKKINKQLEEILKLRDLNHNYELQATALSKSPSMQSKQEDCVSNKVHVSSKELSAEKSTEDIIKGISTESPSAELSSEVTYSELSPGVTSAELSSETAPAGAPLDEGGDDIGDDSPDSDAASSSSEVENHYRKKAALYLTPTKGNKVKVNVTRGIDGDRLFTKNCAELVCGRATLMNSSVSGNACTAIKGSVAKPKLSKKKMRLVKACFVNRVRDEDPVPTDEIIKARTKRVNSYVAEKIKTLLRSEKQKKC